LVAQADLEDREVVAFLASCLAVGRASLVVKAGRDLLARIGKPIARRLAEASPGSWAAALEGFVYRFFSARRLGALLDAIGTVLRVHGSLEAAWKFNGVKGWPALDAFSALFRSPGADVGVLVPAGGSDGASKRLNLFLRWMVRRDEIDPGLWSAVSPPELFMPVDTHVLQWARAEALTARRAADRRACLEVTEALRALCPEDPLRYDFAITRAGMDKKNTLRDTGLRGSVPLLSSTNGLHPPGGMKAFGGIMQKYVCDVCGYIYDPEVGDPDNDIEAGTSFEALPDDWVCPMCGASKDDFSLSED
jgi:uncharacterized protein (TIGR02757 family)